MITIIDKNMEVLNTLSYYFRSSAHSGRGQCTLCTTHDGGYLRVHQHLWQIHLFQINMWRLKPVEQSTAVPDLTKLSQEASSLGHDDIVSWTQYGHVCGFQRTVCIREGDFKSFHHEKCNSYTTETEYLLKPLYLIIFKILIYFQSPL